MHAFEPLPLNLRYLIAKETCLTESRALGYQLECFNAGTWIATAGSPA